ncbi:hypothetical protein QTG56_26085 (plasmid) [Rossellomorea sp. AcN35-11]|nr:hypothetical protein [Rossellomorea aquimaris]WJV32087.1 hypothetical protein QTG56_26085 [Rossellomorea sp. AcN35-11]
MEKYFEITVSRSSKDELREAIEDKINDGWELSMDIRPMPKTGNRFACGSYLVTKYYCKVKKLERLARAGRRVSV